MGWFYTITEEMIQWGLTGSELLVYALINRYSQKGQGCYWGSLYTTAKVCGISRATAIRTLQSLTEKGFILKSKAVVNDEFKTIYIATRVSKCDSEYQNDTVEGIKMTPNNKDRYINNTLSNKGGAKFQKPSVEEIRKYCAEKVLDVDAEQFFNFYESKGWMVGKSPMKNWRAAIATWAGRRDQERQTRTPRPQPQRKESVFEHNMRVMDKMFGTNYHEQMYGEKEESCDEQ